ncbi:MAG: IS21-like element helper ATPase IstB [Planctomycetaceae bacterium]|nr:IS21-like element helper ATPase IstB [Planctomycetaceae bacterium]MBV8311745.1 IS21-like element helper ATPase IstB [Planctomycetaceae bacterium]
MKPSSNDLRPKDSLTLYLRGLKLPAFVSHHEEVATMAEKNGWTFGQYLHHLCELEHGERRDRKVERLERQSGLPREKTMGTLDLNRFPAAVRRQVPALCEGGFASRAENVLVFGLPGRGKTHLCCAVAFELIRRGLAVLFIATYQLVQRLLIAKRELRLEKELKALDRYDVVILDDIGYVQQERGEMEVLFTFLAERYERRSVMITSNLVFSQWDKIFKDPMTTAAAIDRLVHHSIIIELSNKSIREEEAQKRNGSKPALEEAPAK